jgi:hypothetical protein
MYGGAGSGGVFYNLSYLGEIDQKDQEKNLVRPYLNEQARCGGIHL